MEVFLFFISGPATVHTLLLLLGKKTRPQSRHYGDAWRGNLASYLDAGYPLLHQL